MRSIEWRGDHLVVIDQTVLPGQVRWIELRTVDQVVDAIARLAVRGAPALGVIGALAVGMAALGADDAGQVRDAAKRIRDSRPTAVNLGWGVDRALARVDDGADAVVREGLLVLSENLTANRALSERGADLVQSLVAGRIGIHTHCNTGALACVEWGTALGIIRCLHERGAVREVLVDETRPLLQGSRLTALELQELSVPFRVVVDGAGPSLIARHMVDVVIVGADRIAANGDVANKIGTYPLALAAARAAVPFVVAAPESTIDAATATGADIAVEERDPLEVLDWQGMRVAPDGSAALNPAFDVTPHDLVTAIVTERRVIGGVQPTS